jgi:hypothetical protein
VSVPPHLAPSRVMQAIKGKTSHHLLMDHRKLRTEFWGRHLWSRGCFVCSWTASISRGGACESIGSSPITGHRVTETQRLVSRRALPVCSAGADLRSTPIEIARNRAKRFYDASSFCVIARSDDVGISFDGGCHAGYKWNQQILAAAAIECERSDDFRCAEPGGAGRTHWHRKAG